MVLKAGRPPGLKFLLQDRRCHLPAVLTRCDRRLEDVDVCSGGLDEVAG